MILPPAVAAVSVEPAVMKPSSCTGLSPAGSRAAPWVTWSTVTAAATTSVTSASPKVRLPEAVSPALVSTSAAEIRSVALADKAGPSLAPAMVRSTVALPKSPSASVTR
ncbi:hypothetical protein ACFQY5_00930 [Paeniroseomonas aquatica]|uniref:hypothetical protein n=1 Tax=Paeniroseomonas aquatica TaxID=373043 RepID=UPI00360F0DD2